MDEQKDKQERQRTTEITETSDKIRLVQDQAMKDFIATISELDLTSLEILNLVIEIAQRLADQRARK